MEDPTESRVVYTFGRGKRQEIRILVKKYNAHYYMDLRVWYQPENSQDFRPTRKGLCLPLEFSGELQKGVERLAKVADRFSDFKPPRS